MESELQAKLKKLKPTTVNESKNPIVTQEISKEDEEKTR